MALEIEVKIRISNWNEFKARLMHLNALPLSARHFEDNFVLDTRERELRSQACLLRVRKTQDGGSVTFKGPPQPSELFKSREEIETVVENADTMLEIFARIGLKTWFRYQKYREEYSVPVQTGPVHEIKVAMDSTSIGDYAELEGSEEGIKEVAAKLGVRESQFLRDSYYALFERYCRDRGEEPEQMVFR